MQEPLMFEVKAEDRSTVQEILKAYSADVQVVEAKNLTGTEVLLLMLKYGPGIISAGIAIYSAFNKKGKSVTVVLQDGKRIENLSQEQLEALLRGIKKE